MAAIWDDPRAPYLEMNPREPMSEITAWYARYNLCRTYFFDYTQYSEAVIALAEFLNIQLPHSTRVARNQVKLRPYIRRLIVTGYDTEEVLSLWFGADWKGGVGRVLQQERLNYMLAAMSTSWFGVKQAYDFGPAQSVPFLKELEAPDIEALRRARDRWANMQNLITEEDVIVKSEREAA
ncbi:uncharacterized protein C8A04DRAFT_24943 [Dichotomopilus funicola]|uniref:Uncharacterized protein n=1 Tax=Dichotomopilus funicola TaxID=1934379 RepID=A0AAN6V9E0_9PEZI|nr:hypothetical protein C8A04DRAFT_24943 [Dichotomopilus funicola]